MYYAYVYLDPRVQGRFEYHNMTLLFSPFYIGKGKGQRAKSHLKRKDKSPITHKIKSIREAKIEPIILILNMFEDEEEAFDFEQAMVDSIGYGKNGPLVNQVAGGRGFPRPIDKLVKKMSSIRLGRKLTEEHKKNISASLKGRPKPPGFGAAVAARLYGHKWTDEQKQAITGVKRKHRSAVSIEKARKTMLSKNFKHSEESKAIMSHKAKQRPRRPKTEDEIDKFVLSISRRWEITFPNGATSIVDSLKSFCQEYSISYNVLVKSNMKGRPIASGKNKGFYAKKLSNNS